MALRNKEISRVDLPDISARAANWGATMPIFAVAIGGWHFLNHSDDVAGGAAWDDPHRAPGSRMPVAVRPVIRFLR